MKLAFKKNYHLGILPIISVIGGLWQGQYTDDPYHWGFIFSNALDMINGRVPYREIFIEYGILSTVIHATTLIIFEKNIFSLIGITCIFYSLSIFLIGKIIQNITFNKYYGFLSTLILIFIYPWPVWPYINFISFFFTVLFCFYYLKNKRKYYILSGISLAFAYLSFTTVYNFIVVFFILFMIIFLTINKKSIQKEFLIKNIYALGSFVFIILIFLLYLIINNIFIVWIDYQKLPFIQADAFNITLYQKAYDYVYFLTIYSLKNFIYEPQLSFFSIIFFGNIYLIIKYLFFFNTKKNFTLESINLFSINILIFSLNFYAQLADIDKLSTSLSLGIISLFLIINSFKNIEKVMVCNFVILFISAYSFIFAFDLEHTKYGASRGAYFKDLRNIDSKYNNKNITYFINQKWSKNSWNILDSFIKEQEKIKKNCMLEYGANLTTNTYLYTLLDFKKIQVIPFFYKNLGSVFRKHFDKNLLFKLQNQINKENILIITFENNDKLLNLSNYSKPIKIDLNTYNEKIAQYLYIYVPKKCISN